MNSEESRIFMDMAGSIGRMEGDISLLKERTDKIPEIAEKTNKNTDQISEIRRSLPRPNRFQFASILSKIWPLVVGALTGAAIIGAAFAEKLFK